MASSNSILISGGGAGGPVWTDTTATSYTIATNITAAPMVVNQGGKITLRGKDADVDINGMSLKKTLQGIQQRLGIMEVNKELESEFEQLQELGRQYREMESQLLEQKQVFDILKNKDIK